MPHNITLCRKHEEITDYAPSLHDIEAHKLTTSQNSKLHTTSSYKRYLTLSILCVNLTFSFHTPQRPPKSSTIFSYTFYIFLNLVNIPVPSLPWPYYKIICVRTCTTYNTHQRILLSLNNLKKNNIPTQ